MNNQRMKKTSDESSGTGDPAYLRIKKRAAECQPEGTYSTGRKEPSECDVGISDTSQIECCKAHAQRDTGGKPCQERYGYKGDCKINEYIDKNSGYLPV
ncbi:MAG: hypothetical protein ABSB79_01020 [Syntrophales bacterium]|jgi:hypothetical protein